MRDTADDARAVARGSILDGRRRARLLVAVAAPRLTGQRTGTGSEGASPSVVTYQDYVCPFCYVSEAPLAQLRADGVKLQRRAFELCPAPLPLARAVPDRSAWDEAVVPLAQRFGVEIRWPPQPARTRKAHEAAAHARTHGLLEEMHAAIFRAHFVEGRDIGRIDVLAAIGGEVGLDAGDLRFALDADRWTEAVVADGRTAAALGIAAVPAFLRETAAGADALLGVRDHATLRAWAQNHTGTGRDA